MTGFVYLLLAPLDLLVNLLAFPLAPLIVLLTSASGPSSFVDGRSVSGNLFHAGYTFTCSGSNPSASIFISVYSI